VFSVGGVRSCYRSSGLCVGRPDIEQEIVMAGEDKSDAEKKESAASKKKPGEKPGPNY